MCKHKEWGLGWWGADKTLTVSSERNWHLPIIIMQILPTWPTNMTSWKWTGEKCG